MNKENTTFLVAITMSGDNQRFELINILRDITDGNVTNVELVDDDEGFYDFEDLDLEIL